MFEHSEIPAEQISESRGQTLEAKKNSRDGAGLAVLELQEVRFPLFRRCRSSLRAFERDFVAGSYPVLFLHISFSKLNGTKQLCVVRRRMDRVHEGCLYEGLLQIGRIFLLVI